MRRLHPYAWAFSREKWSDNYSRIFEKKIKHVCFEMKNPNKKNKLRKKSEKSSEFSLSMDQTPIFQTACSNEL